MISLLHPVFRGMIPAHLRSPGHLTEDLGSAGKAEAHRDLAPLFAGFKADKIELLAWGSLNFKE